MSRMISQPRTGLGVLSSILFAAFLTLPANAQSPAPVSSGDNGSVWWNELVSANPDKAREFYGSVIGWTPKIVSATDDTRPPAPGEADYTLFTANGTEQAGLTKYDSTKPNDPKPGWLTYIQVPDVDAAVVEAMKLGGKVLKAPTDADNVGRIAVIQDPDGNPVGLVAPLAKESKVAGH
jgi:uncharacterized protein